MSEDKPTYDPTADRKALTDLRHRIAKGEKISDEEVAEAVLRIRGERMSAVNAGKKTARKRKTKLPEPASDLLKQEVKT